MASHKNHPKITKSQNHTLGAEKRPLECVHYYKGNGLKCVKCCHEVFKQVNADGTTPPILEHPKASFFAFLLPPMMHNNNNKIVSLHPKNNTTIDYADKQSQNRCL